MFLTPRRRRVAGLLVVLMGLVLVGSLSGIANARVLLQAQDSAAPPPRPGHLHRGTCATVGDLLSPLAAAAVAGDRAGGTPLPEAITGMTAAIPVAVSTTTIPLALADLLAEPASIEMHESEAEPWDVVACGNLGGTVTGPDLVIGLAPVGPHGVPGAAWFQASGEATLVTIFLVEGLPASIATPVAPEGGAGASPETVTVTLGGPAGEFTVTASQTTFRAGVPYHFVVTNSGVLPHEFVIMPAAKGEVSSTEREQMYHLALGLIDEEELPAGATRTVDVTFTEPAPAGTLEIACLLAGHHESGMYVPIEVES